MRELLIVQQHLVGSQRTNSLTVISPAQITREYDINPSRGFTLKVDRQTKASTLNVIDTTVEKSKGDIMIPTGESFQASAQQVSSSEVQ
ncbi:MAG: hypothetical protein WA364_15985 [Candidatus Nitrosopolaris sp.]